MLLAHGNLDQRVPSSTRKDARGVAGGRQEVEWIELRGEGHGISDPDNRERFYNALFAFLARNTAAPGEGVAVSGDPTRAGASQAAAAPAK